MDGWKDGWLDGWMDDWLNGSVDEFHWMSCWQISGRESNGKLTLSDKIPATDGGTLRQ